MLVEDLKKGAKLMKVSIGRFFLDLDPDAT